MRIFMNKYCKPDASLIVWPRIVKDHNLKNAFQLQFFHFSKSVEIVDLFQMPYLYYSRVGNESPDSLSSFISTDSNFEETDYDDEEEERSDEIYVEGQAEENEIDMEEQARDSS